ncbi:MAG TPA: diguanylate cyclase [Steroidobacteraceae bacterium]|jgi:diguanylate cyclase (GGDEF)-like protein/PAS domain S-box-containing protein|nr:diguanylate cyclase [Steroidobacteraceae bacterium]
MTQWSIDLLRGVLDAAPEGIVVCESRQSDQIPIYVNAAFEKLCGYSGEELLGQDLRRLQKSDRESSEGEQDGRQQLRESIARGESTRAVVRNYRKDGTGFWNEVLIQPIRGADGQVTHYVGFHRDVGERERTGIRRMPGLASWLREDRLSGLCSRAYFEELLQHDWDIGIRESRLLTLLAFDISDLEIYNDTFGRSAGDACIRRVAGVIGAAFKRGADVVARWDGGCIVALARSGDVALIPAFASSIAQKVQNQMIHNPRSTRGRFVTVNVGAASFNPVAEKSCDVLVQAALRALDRARRDREGRVAIAQPEEMA